jgi:hypothetical protein
MQKDLGHADWLLFTQIQLFKSVNPSIICEIIETPETNQKRLFASNVSEIDILNLQSITNTDVNNNYLYLENFSVYLRNNPSKPLNLPGFNELMINLYRQSDYNAFIQNQKTHIMFSTADFQYTTFLNNTNNNVNNNLYGSDINSFIDLFTGILPFTNSTSPGQKIYSILLNPDSPNIADLSGTSLSGPSLPFVIK